VAVTTCVCAGWSVAYTFGLYHQFYSSHTQVKSHSAVSEIIPFVNTVNVFTGIYYQYLLRLTAEWQSIHVFEQGGPFWAMFSVTAIIYSQNHIFKYHEMSIFLIQTMF